MMASSVTLLKVLRMQGKIPQDAALCCKWHGKELMSWNARNKLDYIFFRKHHWTKCSQNPSYRNH